MDIFLKDLTGNKKAGYIFSLMMIFFVLFSFVITLVFGIIGVSENTLNALSTLAIAIASVFSGVLTKKDKKDVKNLFNKKFNPLYLILTVTLSFSMIFGLGFTNALIERLFSKIGLNTATTELKVNSVSEYIEFAVFLALIPAIFEELFFRGALISEINTTDTFKVIISALCFSLYHVAISKLVYQFIYGVILALIYIKTKNLILSIITHFLNNFIILSVEFFNIEVNLFNPITLSIGLVVMALSVYFLVKNHNFNEHNENSEKVKDFFIPNAIMGVIICLIMIISGLFL